MDRRVFGRTLLALVLSLGSAALVAPQPAMAQAPVLRTAASVSTVPAVSCRRRAPQRCRQVRRLVVRGGALRPRRWARECGAAVRLMPGTDRSWRLVSATPFPRCRWPM